MCLHLTIKNIIPAVLIFNCIVFSQRTVIRMEGMVTTFHLISPRNKSHREQGPVREDH